MALLVGASFRFVVGARESATESTIAKANSILQDRLRSFDQTDFTDAVTRYANISGNTIELSEVLVRKVRLRKAFPQSFAEADPSRFGTDPSKSGSFPLYDRKYESGIVLYALLTKGETFGSPSVNSDVFNGSEIKVAPETASLPCLVDAWGEPIRFYRWPTRLFKPTGNSFTATRTYAFSLVSNVGNQAGYGPDGLPGVAFVDDDGANGIDDAGEQGWYGSDDVPNCGPDGKPGVAGIDDDNDGTTDNLTELGWLISDDIEPLNVDAGDPLLRLSTVLTSASRVCQFETGNGTCGSTPSPLNAFHTPFTYTPMLLVSSGPDRRLGLFEPADLVNFGYLGAPDLASGQSTTLQYLVDNPTNLNRKAGGK